MKKNKYFWNGGILTLFLSLLISCSQDFLDRPPLDSAVDASFYQNDDQVLAGSSLLYNQVWFSYNDNASYQVGDLRGGTIRSGYYSDVSQFNSTANSTSTYDVWKASFITIGQSNTYIVNINKYAGSEVTPSIKSQTIAEARFMRATAYRYLVMNFGAVPIIENNFTLVGDTTKSRNTVGSVWKYITKEYRAAAEGLGETPLQEGRITKWAAEGMLARTYLTRAGVGASPGNRNQVFLDSAQYYADRVIKLSGAKLEPKYADLFLTANENNAESLFSLQWRYNGSYSETSNTIPGNLAYGPEISNGDGYGGSISATWWMLQKYDGFTYTPGATPLEDSFQGKTLDQRLKASFMLPGAHYPEITQTKDNVDQQLVFGYDASTDWSYASIKKYVVGKAVDNGGEGAQQSYGINTYMLRLAEVYLIYAEAALGNQESTTDAKALEYFNMVHTRAGLNPYILPLTWKKIFDERIIEFPVESVAWYDLVRLHYYNPQLAYNIISTQDREAFYITPDRFPDPTSWTFKKTPYVGEERRYFQANDGNFELPLPARELAQAPNLAKAPVDYYAEN